MDSMVLLHVLQALAPGRGWTLIAAHLNHQLRGRSSDADERFVKAACRRLAVRCVSARRDVKGLASRRGISTEMAARAVRHRFLSRSARRAKCPVMAMAHHADDQAELVLLRLLRGSGSEGLGGMSVAGSSPADAGIRLVRPLLETPRARIAAYARQAGIRFREDRSNADCRFLRNRVRHELLPLLRAKYQPAIDRVLVRVASILSTENEYLTGLASGWLKDGGEPFDRLPLALRRRVVQLQSTALGLGLDFETCEELLGKPGRPVNTPGGAILALSPDGRLMRVPRRTLAHMGEALRVRLGAAGRVRFAGRDFTWRTLAVRGSLRRLSRTGEESFDADRVGDKVVLRHWRAGDRFQPIGMDWPVKLQDLFTNHKVPAAERRGRVVAESGAGEIFWVEGLRIGERFKVRLDTAKRLVWRWKCG
jgi:tRNA(Ile)-lysidine synthase